MLKQQRQFDAIYKANYQKVIRICMGYVNGNKALASDIAQEVFVKVWKSLAGFREEAAISTWIYRITVNTCLLELRKKKYTQPYQEYHQLPETLEEPYADKEKQLKKMYQCIAKLSKGNRAIILLELEGLPQKEIAEIMGISHEAVRVRVHRIKNSLTKCVKNDSI